MSTAVAERRAAAQAPLADLEEVAVSLPPLQQPRSTSFKGWEAAKKGLLPGDHVWVSCGVYGHHAIYVGDGRFIHKVSGSGSLATAAFSCNASVVSVGASTLLASTGGILASQGSCCVHPQFTYTLQSPFSAQAEDWYSRRSMSSPRIP